MSPGPSAADRDGLTVAAVLRRFLPAWRDRGPAADRARTVLRRLSRCFTGELGWSWWHCDDCHQRHWRPAGCGDRHCPACQGRQRAAWLARQRQALLPVRYYHWVFTLPAVLRPLALQNPKAIYTLLFDAAAQTLLEFGQERFAAQLGVTALLHTWAQNLSDHPHLHCLVTGGGLHRAADGTTTWRGPKQARYLFPVKAVAARFAGRFLAGLERLRPDLTLTGALAPWQDPGVWTRTRAILQGQSWVVFAKGSVAGPEAVLEYLGRYTHRVALANGRLVRMDDRTVTFRYKDYRRGDQLRELTLTGEEFVRRLAAHVLPAGFTKIRHYGLLGNNQRARRVPLARTALASSRWHQPLAPAAPATTAPAAAPRPANGCPACGSARLTCVGRLTADGRFRRCHRTPPAPSRAPDTS